jgi:LEA14-like dessication related protein
MKRIILISVIVSLFGCGQIIKEFVDTPEIRGVELKSFSAVDKTAIFEVALYNPNNFSLPISGLVGGVKLNQMMIGSIDAKSDQSLLAHTTQRVTLPISLNTNALVKAIRAVMSQGQAHYSFEGNVKTSVAQIPFSKKGELSVNDLISAFLK